MISPLSASHSGLLQTSTTIYDVLIAFLGGLAGIIAISSKNKGNIIAGAAIATALMPPLCTAGFGLANGNWNFFLSAMYLFAINVVFIAISSVLICRVLKFPVAIRIEGNQKRRVHQWLTFISLVTLVPSVYFGYALVQRERFSEKANQLITELNVFEGSYLLKSQVDARARKITLVYGGRKLTRQGNDEIIRRANVAHLAGARIRFRQGFSLQESKENISRSDQLKSEVNRLNAALLQSRRQSDSIGKQTLKGKQLLQELRAIWPEIQSCSYAETVRFGDAVKAPTKIIVLQSSGKQPAPDAKRKITAFLKQRLQDDQATTFFN